jgi:sugar phosphate isomerase/epimerase
LTEVGFHTIHFSPMFGGSAPVLDVIRLTGAAGFDAVGIDLASVEAHGAAADVATAISDAGLRCTDVLVLVAGADGDLPATARRLGRMAATVGAPTGIAAVAAPVPWTALVTTLGECASILADHGCRLAIESLHFFRSGAPWAALGELSAQQIAVVQWDDAPVSMPRSLVEESRSQRLLPGEGGLALADLAEAIRATGWDGVVSAEILSDPFRRTDPAIAIPATYAAMTRPAAGWT